MQIFPKEKQSLNYTEKKVKALVNEAYAFFIENSGNMKTVQRAFETKFRDDENQLYIFMHSYNAEKKEAICIAHGIKPQLIGKNMWGLRTPHGRLLFQEEIELISKNDEFWLEYEWLNPYSNTIQIKKSLFKKVTLQDGRSAWIGSGYWKK
ncbi:MAG TPA: cache domain-containing protein [Spirochaetota bacterium]|nr:cache domain-containing protein [Spirochaetota bacterium]